MNRLLPRRVNLQRLIPATTGEAVHGHQAENPSTALVTIDIDIGKDVLHIVGFGADGTIAFRRKIKRLALTNTFRKLRRVWPLWKPASAHISSAVSFASSGTNPGSFRRSM